jgi:flagellar export protein FliJ
MRSFQFNLQKLLNLRIKEEELAAAELKAALVVVHGIEDELEHIKVQRRGAEEALLKARSEPSMDIFRILRFEEGMALLAVETRKARKRLMEAQKKADEVREKYRLARQAREGLERIREKQHKRYMLKIKAEEQKLLDEVAVTRFMQHQGREKLSV